MLVARSRLARDLEKLGLEPGGVMMVHCRMSALGRVVGGAQTVVRALMDALGLEGTLVAYTGRQDAPPDDLDALDPNVHQRVSEAVRDAAVESGVAHLDYAPMGL
jgi:aminoglycoside 3-N-acetyltransferase